MFSLTSRLVSRPSARSFGVESSQQETIAAAKKGSIGILTLNRPKALNALNNTVMHEVVAQLEAYDKDPDVRTIIITGSGEKAFAAGADIKMMASLSYMDVQKGKMFQEWDRIMKVSKPIIAAVNGFALGGGCELAMMCDIIVAADTAKFGQPEIKLGTIPGMGGTQRLVRAVGKSKAMELVLGGGMWSAAEAEKAGLVARVYPLADLMAETEKLAETIGGYSVPIVALAKDAVNQAYETTLTTGLMYEKQAFYSTFATKDQKEGMAAFVEKKTPVWEDE